MKLHTQRPQSLGPAAGRTVGGQRRSSGSLPPSSPPLTKGSGWLLIGKVSLCWCSMRRLRRPGSLTIRSSSSSSSSFNRRPKWPYVQLVTKSLRRRWLASACRSSAIPGEKCGRDLTQVLVLATVLPFSYPGLSHFLCLGATSCSLCPLVCSPPPSVL